MKMVELPTQSNGNVEENESKLTYGYPLIVSQMYKLSKLD
jgi:hypothetical protein